MSTDLLVKHDDDIMSFLPSDSFQTYFQKISKIKLLSSEEEKSLAEDLKINNNMESAKKLILSHLRFVAHIARSYLGYGLPIHDLVQEGNIGLMKAVKNFDPQHGVRLSSFSAHYIRAEIHEYVMNNIQIVKFGTTKAKRKLFFNLKRLKSSVDDGVTRWLTQDQASQIASTLNVSVDEVFESEQRIYAVDDSYDRHSSDEDNGYLSPLEYLCDQNSFVSDTYEQEQYTAHVETSLHEAISELDPRSRDIIESRFLKNEASTLHELADKYSVSAERIRQLESNTLKKLRQSIGGVL